MDIKKNVYNTITRHKLIKAGDVVLLGFSGGPDSLCLFHVLKDLAPVIGFELFAAHINHGIRGLKADEDAAWADAYCKKHNVSHIAAVADVAGFSKDNHLSEEEAGRKIRREAFVLMSDQLSRLDPSGKRSPVRVALAHNSDDQAETVLMRILRGTGTRGLSGIQYESPLDDTIQSLSKGMDDRDIAKRLKDLDVSIVRPLLDVSRAEIEAFCEQNGLEPRIDHTNSQTDYTRNRIRLELLPQLEKDFNPNIKETLVRLAANAAEDEAVLSSLSAQACANAEKVVSIYDTQAPEDTQKAIKSLQLDASVLRRLDPAIFKRVVTSEFAKLGLLEGISAVHLNALHSAVAKNVGGKVIEFPGGHTAELRAGTLTLR